MMISHSKTTNSNYISLICYLIEKTKLISSGCQILAKIKLHLAECLKFYVKKNNIFNDVFLIATTYIDPWIEP